MVLSIAAAFAAVAFHVVQNPSSVQWLSPYLGLGGAAPTSPDVLHLTASDFDDAVADNENLLVEFYAPWCGHCKELAPKFAAAASILKGKATLAAIDGTEYKEIADRHSVKSFPTLVWYNAGELIPYNGGRSTDDIITWVRKRTIGAVLPITSIEGFLGDKEAAIIALLGEGDNTERAAIFNEAALADNRLKYGSASDASAFEGLEVPTPGLVMLRQFSSPAVLDWSGDAPKETLTRFIGLESTPVVREFEDSLFPQLADPNVWHKKVLFVFGEITYDLTAIASEPEIREITTFVTVRSHEKLKNYLGGEGLTEPCAVMIEFASPRKIKKFPLGALPVDKLAAVESIKAHVLAVQSGSIMPTYVIC